MDFRIAELFKESGENSKIRDAQHTMPISQIPDLGWKLDEVVSEIKPVTVPDTIDPATAPEDKTP